MRIYAYYICVRNADKLNNKARVFKSPLSHIFPKLFLEHLPKNYLDGRRNKSGSYKIKDRGDI